MTDKNGILITKGSIIFNEFDKDRFHEIIENENLVLSFSDGTELTEKYQTEKFWEVITEPYKCNLCGQYFSKSDLSQVIKHEHKNLTK